MNIASEAARQRRDDTDVANRLHSAAIHLLRRLRVTDAESGLSPPRLSALSVIVFGGPIRPGALAAAEQVTPPTISRLLRELEDAKLIRRVADPADGRASLVTATPEGRRILDEGRRRRVAALATNLSRLDSDDRATLDRATPILERLALPTKDPERGR